MRYLTLLADTPKLLTRHKSQHVTVEVKVQQTEGQLTELEVTNSRQLNSTVFTVQLLVKFATLCTSLCTSL